MDGAFGKNGALEQLGLKYFHELYFEQIGSDEYRGVLRFMSEHGTEWVTKEQIRKAVKLKDTTLNNAINALKKRHIILPKDGRQGVYRLPTTSFAVWIRAYQTLAQSPAIQAEQSL
jgi:RIO-like serine/threonine protein kinase